MAERRFRFHTGATDDVLDLSPYSAEETTVMRQPAIPHVDDPPAVVHVYATEDIMTFTHRVSVGRDVCIHGHHYDVGELGYHWIFDWPNGMKGEHYTQDVSFVAGSVGIYRLHLPVVGGEVVIEVIAE